MIFHEAEDFLVEVWGQTVGRFIVESVKPFEFDYIKEYDTFCKENDLAKGLNSTHTFLNYMLKIGRISVYEPDYKVVMPYPSNELKIRVKRI